jgi:hypothetical protein
MRDPAIHIRRSDLLKIFNEVWGANITEEAVTDLFLHARKYSIKNRVQVTTKAKAKKKADRSVESDTNLLEKFNGIYQSCLVAHSIKSMTIGKTSPQFLTLKEVCFAAKEFSDLNTLGYETGMRLYVEIGIKLLGNKFSIYRLKGTALRILEYYQAKALITSDPNPDGTDDMVTAWVQAVKVFYHTSIALEDDAQRAHFIHAREDADSLKAEYYDWMAAQFEKYLYLGNLPAFSQLYGDNAKLNYQIYMAKSHKDNKTKEEQEYFNKVKNNETTIKTKTAVEEARVKQARIHSGV